MVTRGLSTIDEVRQRRAAYLTKKRIDEKKQAAAAHQLMAERIAAKKKAQVILFQCEEAAISGRTKILVDDMPQPLISHLSELGFAVRKEKETTRAIKIRKLEGEIELASERLRRTEEQLRTKEYEIVNSAKSAINDNVRYVNSVYSNSGLVEINQNQGVSVQQALDLLATTSECIPRIAQSRKVPVDLANLISISQSFDFAHQSEQYQTSIEEQIARKRRQYENYLRQNNLDDATLNGITQSNLALARHLKECTANHIKPIQEEISVLKKNLATLASELDSQRAQSSPKYSLSWDSSKSSVACKLRWLSKKGGSIFRPIQSEIERTIEATRKRTLQIIFYPGRVEIGDKAIKIPGYMDAQWLLDTINTHYGFGYRLNPPNKQDCAKAVITF